MVEQIIIRILSALKIIVPYIEFICIALILLILSRIILVKIRRKLIKNAKNKKQISDIKIFSRIFNIIFLLIIFFIMFFSYVGSWSGLGIFAGLLTAGLGFALQKPITGIAAWLMVVVKKPFQIGDRIKIGDVKGEVYDMTLTHIYIDETGGISDTEDSSGRNIMIPNYRLFESDIINYTLTHDLIMGEINFIVSFNSNIDKSIRIAEDLLHKYVEDYAKQIKKETSVRMIIKENGIIIKMILYAPVSKIGDLKSKITKEIFDSIKKEKDIDFAAPDGKEISKKFSS